MRPVSWPATIGVALLTAPAACLAAGYVASRYASWYAWSQREGAAGYAVIAWALLGLVAGAVLGGVVARVFGAALGGGFVRPLGGALAGVLLLAGTAFGLGRLGADPPPRLDGERLHLQVELRWPADRRESPAAPPGGVSRVVYERAALLGGGRRRARARALWVEDAR
ncbi:hypothetical protein PYV61_20220, partial [Roseisolibacter sp. H3M3-2]